MRAKIKISLGTLGALLLLGSTSFATPAAMDTEFRTAYPLTAPSATTPIAGVQLAKLVIPGLQITARSEHAADDGGVVLSLADSDGAVQALVHLAVAADPITARGVMNTELHGVATLLTKTSEPTLGDLVWADDGGKGTALVIATQANVAYSVAVVGAAAHLPTAAALAGVIRKAMVLGRPTFPAVSVTLPTAVDAKAGGPVHISVPDGSSYKVHAEGGYLARGQGGPVVRPFGPGSVTVYATVVDELLRVTVAAAKTVAK